MIIIIHFQLLLITLKGWNHLEMVPGLLKNELEHSAHVVSYSRPSVSMAGGGLAAEPPANLKIHGCSDPLHDIVYHLHITYAYCTLNNL